jgi:hypothetical protein
MIDTFGQLSLSLFKSDALSQLLASRFQTRTAWAGLTGCSTTWKEKVTPAGRRIPVLNVLEPPTVEADFIGSPSHYPTPTATDAARGVGTIRPHDTGLPLLQIVSLADYPTPMASDYRDRGKWDDPAIQRRVQIGKSIELSMMVGSISGATENGFLSVSERKGRLNPDFVCWLMGYPQTWQSSACAAMATLSSFRKPRRSSARS